MSPVCSFSPKTFFVPAVHAYDMCGTTGVRVNCLGVEVSCPCGFESNAEDANSLRTHTAFSTLDINRRERVDWFDLIHAEQSRGCDLNFVSAVSDD
jgi:hypothetical protein